MSGKQTLLLHSRPLSSPIGGLMAWTMTRVRELQGFRPLQLGLAVLLTLMVAISVWLGRTLLVWRRHVRDIEAALRAAGASGMPAVARRGELELDQIIDALNAARIRLEPGLAWPLPGSWPMRMAADLCRAAPVGSSAAMVEDRIEPAGAGWAPPHLPADGSDAHCIGVLRERGIFDTQLGPNRNGRKW